MKYIMIQRNLSASIDDDNVTMYPIIFPKELVHKDVADAIVDVVKRYWPKSEVEIVSAGDISVVFGTTSGFSSTLELESDVADDMVISTGEYFNIHRYRTPNKIK